MICANNISIHRETIERLSRGYREAIERLSRGYRETIERLLIDFVKQNVKVLREIKIFILSL